MSTSTEKTFDQEDLELARRVDVDSLYRRYDKRTFAFLASMGIRGSDADDIHQRAWMRVLEALRKKPFEGHFRGWLFQIIRNTAIDAMRKKRPDSLDTEVAEATIGETSAPDQRLIDAEYQSALTHCLGKLEQAQREIVRGRLAGENYDQISKRLEIPTSRAHRVFFDAKTALATCLGRPSQGVSS